jgi:hypothetical protein
MKRRLTFGFLIAFLLLLALSVQVVGAASCEGTGITRTEEACEPDTGCTIHPTEPNGQEWTTTYELYKCTDGSSYWVRKSKWESGPCCEI